MIYKQYAIANQELHFPTRGKKTSFNRAKKYILYLRKESAQESPGASLDTCSLTVFVLKANIDRPVLRQQLNIL